MIHSSYCWEYFNKNTTDWEVTQQVLQAVDAKAALDLEEWKRWIRGAPTNNKGERKEKYEGRARPTPPPQLHWSCNHGEGKTGTLARSAALRSLSSAEGEHRAEPASQRNARAARNWASLALG